MKQIPTTSLLTVTGALLVMAASPLMAGAQTASPAPAPAPTEIAFSSSTAASPFSTSALLGDSPEAALNPTPQYGGGYGGGHYHRYNQGQMSHFAFEAGGGFTAPVGNDVSGGFTSLIGDGNNYGTDTWGGNFLVGAGWNFSKRFTLLGEFMWNDNKVPGKTLSALENDDFSQDGVTQVGGNIHTLSLTAEPMFYYVGTSQSHYGAYVIGGGGWYHKSTNFTTPVESCSYLYGYCGDYNETFSSFTDNAGGLNLGTGFTYKPMGEYSSLKLFAEARYIWADTARYDISSASGNPHTGTEELIPVTIGIRF